MSGERNKRIKAVNLFTLFRFEVKDISLIFVWKFRKFVMISFWSSRSLDIRKLLVGRSNVFESVFNQIRKLVEFCTDISFIIKYFYVICAVNMIYGENAFFILFNNVMILNEMKFITCRKVHLKNWLWWMISGRAFSTMSRILSTYISFRYYVMCFNSIYHIQGCTKNSHRLPDIDSNCWNCFLLNYEIISHKSYVDLRVMSESTLSYVIIKLLILVLHFTV